MICDNCGVDMPLMEDKSGYKHPLNSCVFKMPCGECKEEMIFSERTTPEGIYIYFHPRNGCEYSGGSDLIDSSIPVRIDYRDAIFV